MDSWTLGNRPCCPTQEPGLVAVLSRPWSITGLGHLYPTLVHYWTRSDCDQDPFRSSRLFLIIVNHDLIPFGLVQVSKPLSFSGLDCITEPGPFCWSLAILVKPKMIHTDPYGVVPYLCQVLVGSYNP
ncbi:hypothetical protein F2Q70_00022088 [Brassica cretica]|uniref:Uncharacterized protein n=2 Tax=Brassica cretica TaxID=69181 RepID=A0A8S9HH47_BRACR|nr:hypothetical protein F2Q70_00022088 [Brassica cretica]KAF2557725.1 hypothetical protein F2Q68_00015893 [Brassica cretica]KAF3607170.1 hypothetical protein DY000_02048442 [Brassica cretica]